MADRVYTRDADRAGKIDAVEIEGKFGVDSVVKELGAGD